MAIAMTLSSTSAASVSLLLDQASSRVVPNVTCVIAVGSLRSSRNRWRSPPRAIQRPSGDGASVVSGSSTGISAGAPPARSSRHSARPRSTQYAVAPTWADGHHTGFYTFERLRSERMVLDQKMMKKQDAQRKHLQAFVDRFRAKASKARQAQSRIKRLAKLEPIAEVVEERVTPFVLPSPTP